MDQEQKDAAETAKALTLRRMRHSFYDWLQAFGVPLMGVGEANRAKAHELMTSYATAHNSELAKQVTILSRTAGERRAAARAKHQRRLNNNAEIKTV